MGSYELLPEKLIQTVRDSLTELTWKTLLIFLVFSCIATRLVTGLQSRQRNQDPWTVRLAPYWIPWVGHGFSFLWNHVGLVEASRWVYSCTKC